MKTSILIPIFNVQDCLKECIDSILQQVDVSKDDIDIVLVDDGSTDSSLDIAIEYAKKDERIFVLSKANGGPGPSTARNAALELMKGTKLREILEKNIQDEKYIIKSYERRNSFDKSDEKYINAKELSKYFIQIQARVYKTDLVDLNELILQDLPEDVLIHHLDSDDYLDKRCISECLKNIKEKNVNIFMHNISTVDEDSNIVEDKAYLIGKKIKTGYYDSGLKMLEKNMIPNLWFTYQGIFKASLLNDFKLRFTNFLYHEDHDFAIILFALSKKIFVCDESLLYYRIRSGSTMNSTKELEFPKTMPKSLQHIKEEFDNFKDLRAYDRCLGFLTSFKEIYKIKNLFSRRLYKKIFYAQVGEFVLKYNKKIFNFKNEKETKKIIQLFKDIGINININNIKLLYLKIKLRQFYRYPKLLFGIKKYDDEC
ncbi:glycosyltransferase family 2 protein [uncultured Campylobacter sp.]|uniref:glycosyltransferase family 2 protein n=1 Tax=uncultured Campylobacter sp. TaxID=218934 RepID=UPI002634D0EE|nr:glycosyltransferase family 2 protein [uncultured Campylobacter sp.]